MNFCARSACNLAYNTTHRISRCVVFITPILALFILFNLTGCATLRPLPTADELPDGVSINHVRPKQVDGGWETNSGIIHRGEDGIKGLKCGVVKQLVINQTMRANLHVVKETCNEPSLTEKETKWIESVATFYARLIDETPAINRFYREYGTVEDDWYLVHPRVRFVHKQTIFSTNKAPRLALHIHLDSDVNSEVDQINAAIAAAGLVHEHFHVLAKLRQWQFDTLVTNETIAYLLSHTVAVEFGMDHAPTPNFALERPLNKAWEEAAAPTESPLKTGIAGLRVAFAMVEKALACPDPRGAIRGTARMAYEQVADQGAMTLADLKKIDALSCDARQLKGDGGITFKCDEATKKCALAPRPQ